MTKAGEEIETCAYFNSSGATELSTLDIQCPYLLPVCPWSAAAFWPHSSCPHMNAEAHCSGSQDMPLQTVLSVWFHWEVQLIHCSNMGCPFTTTFRKCTCNLDDSPQWKGIMISTILGMLLPSIFNFFSLELIAKMVYQDSPSLETFICHDCSPAAGTREETTLSSWFTSSCHFLD